MLGQSEVVLPELLLSEIGKGIDLHSIGCMFFVIVLFYAGLVVHEHISPKCFLLWTVNLAVVGLELLEPTLAVFIVSL